MPESTGKLVVTDEQTLACLKSLAQRTLDLRPEQVAAIEPDTSLVEGLQLDSLKQVVLMASIEESFGFEFSPEDLDRIQEMETVADLVGFVRERATAVPEWK
jgi:acyl carrier protein